MAFDLRRLRIGEVVIAGGVALVLVSLFALRWYGAGTRADGWNSATNLRWLLLVAVAFGLAAAVTQVAFRAPAIPSALDVPSTVIAFLTVIGLLIRVVISPGHDQLAGPWVALAGGVALLVGSFVALRQEGIPEREGPQDIPVIELPGMAR